MSEVGRELVNLTRALALFGDQEAAAPVVAEMETLRSQRRAFEADRASILARRAGWEAGRRRLADLEVWCRDVAARLGDLTYQQRRLALDALGVGVRVRRHDHTPRYEITASIPLADGAAAQAGQDSMLYVASQNWRTTQTLVTLRWTDRDLV